MSLLVPKLTTLPTIIGSVFQSDVDFQDSSGDICVLSVKGLICAFPTSEGSISYYGLNSPGLCRIILCLRRIQFLVEQDRDDTESCNQVYRLLMLLVQSRMDESCFSIPLDDTFIQLTFLRGFNYITSHDPTKYLIGSHPMEIYENLMPLYLFNKLVPLSRPTLQKILSRRDQMATEAITFFSRIRCTAVNQNIVNSGQIGEALLTKFIYMGDNPISDIEVTKEDEEAILASQPKPASSGLMGAKSTRTERTTFEMKKDDFDKINLPHNIHIVQETNLNTIAQINLNMILFLIPLRIAQGCDCGLEESNFKNPPCTIFARTDHEGDMYVQFLENLIGAVLPTCMIQAVGICMNITMIKSFEGLIRRNYVMSVNDFGIILVS